LGCATANFAEQLPGEPRAFFVRRFAHAVFVCIREKFVQPFGGVQFTAAVKRAPEFDPDYGINPVSPITSSDMRRPMGIALDSKGNAWVAGFDNDVVFQISPDGAIAGTYKLGGTFNLWGIAIDGSDRVWVTVFHNQSVFLLCGVNTAACPPGSKTGDVLSPGTDGFKSPPFQHFTSIQFDESGNIWLSNNWSTVINTVRGENAEFIFTVGNARPLDGALQIATTEMHQWLMSDYGLDSTGASLLMGQCVRYDVANMFDPAYTIVCKMPRRFLA
jgi:hypothetical protein